MSQQEAALLFQERERSKEMERWDKFDTLFGNVVLINVLFLGVEASLDISRSRDITSADFTNISVIWFCVEVTFYTIYVGEAGLRAVFFYQMRQLKDFRTWFGCLPKTMWMLDLQTVARIVKYSPNLLRERMYVYELIIIFIATIDNFILRFIAMQGTLAAVVRVLGLLRLLRVARLVHLVKPLRLIARGFFVNTRLIFWSFMLLLCLIYMVAIAMVDLIGRDSKDPAVQMYWGHVGDAMLTLALMATYNNWGQRIDEVAREHS